MRRRGRSGELTSGSEVVGRGEDLNDKRHADGEPVEVRRGSGAGHSHERGHAGYGDRGQQEGGVVLAADAGVQPLAVVVEPEHALVAVPAVLRALVDVGLADVAVQPRLLPRDGVARERLIDGVHAAGGVGSSQRRDDGAAVDRGDHHVGVVLRPEEWHEQSEEAGHQRREEQPGEHLQGVPGRLQTVPPPPVLLLADTAPHRRRGPVPTEAYLGAGRPGGARTGGRSSDDD